RGLVSRRELLGSAAAVAAFSMVPSHVLRAAAAKPNSVFDGVRIGVITYSYRGVETTAQGTLQAILKSGISEVELMSGPVDDYVGLGGGARGGGPRGGKGKGKDKGAPKSRQEKDAGRPSAQEQRQKRLAVPMTKYEALRKMYNDAGVNIHIVKYDNIGAQNMTDEEIDNCFQAAKAVGAVGITRELDNAIAKRLGPFADKHKIWVAFHNHTQLKPTTYDEGILSYGKFIGINFDVGHYFAGTKGESPMAFMEKYHERIVSLHLKDRTKAGGNLVWGQGETPLKEILQLMRKNKWTFPADIELEYQ
ncbi:MAG: TIM barrel protein, partial [Planctomycetes bacterium]|nr:TIM barrel protein [Planctomycetota bacterium]